MIRWLAALTAVLVIVAIFFLWRETTSSPSANTDDPSPIRDTATIGAATGDTSQGPQLVVPPDAAPPTVDAAVILSGDELHARLEGEYPRTFLEYVAHCYEGGMHRNAKLKVSFDVVIKDHYVSLTNIKPVVSTLTDKAVEACFLAELAKVKFRDDTVPDWTYDDRLLIRPKLLKRFSQDPEADDDPS